MDAWSMPEPDPDPLEQAASSADPATAAEAPRTVRRVGKAAGVRWPGALRSGALWSVVLWSVVLGVRMEVHLVGVVTRGWMGAVCRHPAGMRGRRRGPSYTRSTASRARSSRAVGGSGPPRARPPGTAGRR